MKSDLHQLCLQLYAQGLEPSTSLLRARAESKPSLPQAIDAIRWWQQQEKASLLQRYQTENKGLTNTAKSDEPSELDQHDMINQALSRVAQIEQELTELKQLLQQLAQKN